VVPSGFKSVAWYHTHPHHTAIEGKGFSGGDETYSYHVHKVGYVVDTYSRDAYRFTPSVTKYKPNHYCCGIIGDFVAHIP
jgi:hypothetical protein